MKEFVVLADNRSNNTELLSEHGLSVYVETENHKLLLDTGKSNIFLMNAQKLGIHLEDVDWQAFKDRVIKSGYVYEVDGTYCKHWKNGSVYTLTASAKSGYHFVLINC